MHRPRPKLAGNAIDLDGNGKPSKDKAGVIPAALRVGSGQAKKKVDAQAFRAKAAENMRR